VNESQPKQQGGGGGGFKKRSFGAAAVAEGTKKAVITVEVTNRDY